MKREEKNQKTRSTIVKSAMREFAARGYEAASMNAISQSAELSKGILYHYFESKEELYLCCLSFCFDALTERLTQRLAETAQGNPLSGLSAYFEARLGFFSEQPELARLFAEAAALPPPALRERVEQARAGFDAFNREFLLKLLSGARLREDIPREEMVTVLRLLQDVLNLRLREHSGAQPDIVNREKQSRIALEIFLFGVISREDAQHE